MRLHNPFCSKYYRAPANLARIASNFATLVWATIILLRENALGSAGDSYAWVEAYVHEDLLALIVGGIALVQLAWILLDLPPKRFGHSGYGLFLLFWSFVLFNILFSSLLTGKVIQPTSAGWVASGVFLCAYSFLANPRVSKHE